MILVLQRQHRDRVAGDKRFHPRVTPFNVSYHTETGNTNQSCASNTKNEKGCQLLITSRQVVDLTSIRLKSSYTYRTGSQQKEMADIG